MQKPKMDATITIRCTIEEKNKLSTKAWRKRTTVSAMLHPLIAQAIEAA